jgi:peptide-methionine (R)-S-oxide reductase
MEINEEELKAKLTPEEYHVLREGGTEAPFSGKYYEENKDGMYTCKVCNNPLFASDAKFHSDMAGLAGWPSFDDAIPGATETREDTSLGMYRTEIICAKCKSHLGHIFPDSQAKTGQHFCINSVCLDLKEKE